MARMLAALFVTALGLVAAESETDQVVREIYAQRLVVVLGDVEDFKTHVFAVVDAAAKNEPKVPPIFWSRVEYAVSTREFEAAIVKLYATSFTTDEIRHIVTLLERPKLRGLVYWLKKLPALSAADQRQEIARLAREYGPEAGGALAELVNSALGNQLRAAAEAAAKIRVEQAVPALNAAFQRVRAGLVN